MDEVHGAGPHPPSDRRAPCACAVASGCGCRSAYVEIETPEAGADQPTAPLVNQ